ncbi:MAG: HNH endonuclease signature motif containing protein [Bacteroidota bacterium]
MRKHTKIYLEAFGYDLSDPNQFVPSELGGRKSNDIHHIISRGRGGKDRIENLMALTRKEHEDFGDQNRYIWTLMSVHRQAMKEAGISFDNAYVEGVMNRYAYETEN